MKLTAPTEKDIILKPIRVSAAVEQKYRKRLLALVDEMYRSMVWWIGAAWKKNPPVATVANDARMATTNLSDVMARLEKHWQEKFDEEAEKISRQFVDSTIKYHDTAFMASLKDAGFIIPFSMTKRMQEAGKASLKQSVSLISNLQQSFYSRIEGDVWRAVSNGYDLKTLNDSLRDTYGITKRRAKTISIDQASKAHAVIEKARREELGITQAEWRHSHAGKSPRPTHVAMNRREFDVSKGMYDSAVDRYIWPGSEINCRCYSVSIIPGINK